MKIENLVPGQIVYEISKGKMGNTTVSTVRIYDVKIVSIDLENGVVIAKWNCNPERKYYSRSWNKWRDSKPLTVNGAFGSVRLATREEIKTAKDAANQTNQ